MFGGKKVYKTVKTKFKKQDDGNLFLKDNKKKHHDKSVYRMLRQQQKEDYVI